jgi:hypothetical protein
MGNVLTFSRVLAAAGVTMLVVLDSGFMRRGNAVIEPDLLDDESSPNRHD